MTGTLLERHFDNLSAYARHVSNDNILCDAFINILYDYGCVFRVDRGLKAMMRAMSLSFPILAFAVGLGGASSPAAACGTDAYIGQICIMAGDYCPADTLEAAGQIVPITQYQALYSLTSTTYGGDARTTFGIPDLRGRAPVGYGQGPGLTAHPMGDKFGHESVQQTVAMLAPHNHGATFTAAGSSNLSVSVAMPAVSTDGTTNTPGNTASLAKPADVDLSSIGGPGVPVNSYSTATPDTTLKPFNATVSGAAGGGTVTIANTGSGTAIPTVPPQIALRYCIVVNGLYPPRP